MKVVAALALFTLSALLTSIFAERHHPGAGLLVWAIYGLILTIAFLISDAPRDNAR